MKGTMHSTAVALCFLAMTLLLMGMGTKKETAGKDTRLSAHEETLGAQIGFEREVLLLVKDITPVPFHRLTGYDPNGYQIVVNGITFSVAELESDRVLTALRQRLRSKGYQAFLIAVNEGIKTEEIGILKGMDPYNILRIMQTNGEEYDITTDDIIERLKEWERRYPFEIIGAENEWVEIEFRAIPQDLVAFAGEISEFSPDTVEQDAGSIEELVKDIRRTKRVVLWWEH